MKKIISIMLLIILVFSLTSCGKPKEIKELEKLTKALSEIGTEDGENFFNEIVDSIDDEEFSDDYPDEYSDDFSDVEVSNTAGSELTNFYTFYNDAIAAFEGPINSWNTEDFFMFDAAMDYYMPSIHFVSMSIYDALYFFGNEGGEYKEINGDIIEFGKESTMEEDGFSPNDKQGDIVVEKGILDNSAKTLYFESYTERDGQKISRGISEVAALSDGTFVVQTLTKNLIYDDRLEDKGNAYFMVFDSNKLEVIKAAFTPDVNFTYDSIIGKGKMTVEDMAQGYSPLRKMTVADGVASVEKYD
jgi:hypothetical protein